MDATTLSQRPPAELTDAITQIHAIRNSFHRKELRVIAAYDIAEAWKHDGASSMVSWLTGWLGYGRDTAHQDVRLAHALETLPAISKTYEQGLLSRDQVLAVTEFATPETDEHLAEEARRFSAGHLRRMAQRFKPVPAAVEEEAHTKREFRMRWDLRNKMLTLSGRLPAAEGAVVEKAIERILPNVIDPFRQTTYDHDRYCADALVHLASTHLATDGDADRATVGVHIDASVLVGGVGMAELDKAGAIALETARRLACDSRWYIVADGPGGIPVGIGRTNRQIPAWLAREVRHRDGGCRWVGCERKGWTAIHHVVPWGQGGPTDHANLVVLCGHHHRMVHEGKWRIAGDVNGELRFIGPDGRVLTQGPPAIREEIRERIDRMTADGMSVPGAGRALEHIKSDAGPDP